MRTDLLKGRKATRPAKYTLSPLCRELKAIRQERGDSLYTLARRMRRNPSVIGSWERGNNRVHLDTAEAWAKALGYELELIKVSP